MELQWKMTGNITLQDHLALADTKQQKISIDEKWAKKIIKPVKL